MRKRITIPRWILIALTVLVAARVSSPAVVELSLYSGALVLALAVLLNLGLPMSYGTSAFVPVMALTAYLSLGRSASLWVTIVGLALGGIVMFVRRTQQKSPARAWWVELAGAWWHVAAHGLSILAADFGYVGLGGMPPLQQVTEVEALLPVVAASVLYLLVYNLLLALDVWFAGRPVFPFFVTNRQVLLSVQVLPLPLAPLVALALASLGPSSAMILIGTLLAIAIAVNQLVLAQRRLTTQVRHLTSYSSVSQAVRASLELNELLDSVYSQVTQLLDVDNFYVALSDPDTDQIHFPFVIRNGQREARPWRDRENTFTEWVIDNRKPLLIDGDVADRAKDMGLSSPESGLQCWMGVPLLASERTIGCMVVYSVGQEACTFGDDDLELLGNVAVQVGVAVENAVLYQDAQQHARQLATLNEISTAMNASLDPDQVLEMVSTSVIQVAGCDKTAIYLLDDDGMTLSLGHSEGFSKSYQAVSETLSVPLTELEREAVMQTGKVVAVPDIRSATNVSPGLVALAEGENFRAYANFPLHAHGHTIGLLAVYYDTTRRFSDTDLELLQTFANQAALAVANARQYTVTDRALTRTMDQILLLADINRKLSATLDLDRVFHLVIDSAMDALRATAGMLVVADEAHGGLRIGSWRGYPTDVIKRLQRGNRTVAHGISQRVLSTGKTALVENVSSDPDFVNMGINTRSQLSVPVILEDKVIGVITLEGDQENMFEEEDAAFVAQLAGQAGIAIKNAQLYERVDEVNDRLHAILDASTDGILMLDSESRIVMTNTRMEAFWDFARADFEERSVDEFVADPLSALGEGLGYQEGELTALIARAVRDPDTPEENDLYEAKGRAHRAVERTARPVRDDFGNLIGLLLVFRDVTEAKRLEAARENLGNMIVHDLRNPLTAVLASLTLVNNVVASKDETGVARQATEVSGRAVRKLLVMVNNLLDLGRLEGGEFAPDQKPFDVQKVIENAVGETLPLAMEYEVVIQVDSDGMADLPEVHIDDDMIERVMLNLLDNALKFSPPGTSVSLSTSLIEEESGEDEATKMVQVAVFDSGPGVPDDFKKRIFERYQQVDDQSSRRRGTGLGLAFCRMAVDAHGGRIWVEDVEEGGSAFKFTLPLAPELPPMPPPGDSADET